MWKGTLPKKLPSCQFLNNLVKIHLFQWSYEETRAAKALKWFLVQAPAPPTKQTGGKGNVYTKYNWKNIAVGGWNELSRAVPEIRGLTGHLEELHRIDRSNKIIYLPRSIHERRSPSFKTSFLFLVGGACQKLFEQSFTTVYRKDGFFCFQRCQEMCFQRASLFLNLSCRGVPCPARHEEKQRGPISEHRQPPSRGRRRKCTV